jgi:vacuolar-type H+-ATPase subunit C/Vma6
MPAAELALVARSRGVATHLVSREALESLAAAADVASLVHGLERMRADLEPVGDTLDLAAFELAVNRTAGRHLRTLLRWQPAQPGVLDVFIADQERRSLRALLRGALQGAPAAARMAGLLPTPTLPVAALTELARQASPSAVVAQLIALGYPDAPRLLPLVNKAQPELFAIDVALLRGLAARAGIVARLGDAVLRDFVHERLDIGNTQNALLLAGGPRDVDPGAAFVAGGRWLHPQAFAAAAASASRQECLARLTAALARTPLARMLPVVADDVTFPERFLLSSTMTRLTRAARLWPLGTAPILRVLLRIEAQSRDLRTLAWGVALGTPPALRRLELVTPWR